MVKFPGGGEGRGGGDNKQVLQADNELPAFGKGAVRCAVDSSSDVGVSGLERNVRCCDEGR